MTTFSVQAFGIKAPESRLKASAHIDLRGITTIGGITETQEMLDFCGNHNITSGIGVYQKNPRHQ
jgi:D-arabinose 1-dehydrogenase-like Zn-dependent alcohol dehydrogenase